MSVKHDKTYFFDKPANVKGVMYAFFAFCALLLGADFIFHRHIYHRWEEIPAFYALFGFASYVTIVFTAKLLRKLAMRPGDYYEQGESGDD